MTVREDIKNGRLIYTDQLGWIDLGHAKGDDARDLWGQLVSEPANPLLKDYFLVNYSQAMRYRRIQTGVHAQWKVKKGLPIETKRSIALSMMFYVSLKFEGLQSNFLFSQVTDSGFSCEDLVSNLVGFYSVVLPRNYIILSQPKSMGYAFKIWDYYGPVGRYKNNELKALIFPDPEMRAYPYKKILPPYLSSIKPFSSYENDLVINTIDKNVFLGLKA
ncbi:hypothetical protein [Pectobacterium carotovorum]|uniref:hypothetical protein n=1 Tax=Pectobacterium carotovorum TaxID=554 RepID=UPI0016020B2F|nr:hypothetical protein [Pectobacterium carotovorum]MBB1527548.1 hypothetical protein [Pectobacterium carotovorum subsp. carotovorum]MCA6964262.1 hypothetical protein [Pectobacterium carotovorum]MCH4986695.1 hypothetical protein [Pectobacterium carotovorum]GKV91767.1 hypothetical protein PEC301619_37490 [Pectobacterium carotovorum subsp. carotovorum]